MRTTKMLLAGVTAACVLTMPAFAKKGDDQKGNNADKVEKAEKKAKKGKKKGLMAGLSKEEKEALIKRFDTDKDGKLSGPERKEAKKTLKKEAKKKDGKKGKNAKKAKNGKKGKKGKKKDAK